MSTTENKKKILDTELGQRASVDRNRVSGELSAKANARLRDIGTSLNPMTEHLEYKGSMATHIFQSKLLGQIFFITQTETMQDVPEHTAGAALQNLRSDAMASYGRNRQTKRSGF